MFEARLLNTGEFKNILKAINEFRIEVEFDCSDSGIHLQAMDDTLICLLSMYLKSSSFDKFRCDRKTSLGINLERYKEFLMHLHTLIII